MKVLVTGASGNVGKYVIEELLSMNEKVVAAGTNEEKLKKMWGDKVDTLILDFMNPDTFEKALTGIDCVFLMRPPQLGKPEDIYPFIECMKDYNIKLIAFLSLMGVEKNPVPPHHKIEKFIENSGIPYSHIRPGFFMQNLSGIHGKEIKEKNEIFIPAGKSKVSFIDAADIGLAIAKVLHEPKKYNNTAHTITGQEALDYYEVADILSRLTKQKITYTKPGFLAYRNYYINVRGLDKKYVNVTVALYFMTRMGTAKRVTNEFKQLTGKEPRTFEEFARSNINCFVKGY